MGVASVIFYFALILWTFFAPPNFLEQHAFNMLSPSHDGAFLLEAQHVTSLTAYVSSGFYERLQMSPEQMRGRRILSNPPGMTLVCLSAIRTVNASPVLLDRSIQSFELQDLDREQQITISAGLYVALLMTLLWGLSLWPAYLLARLWLPTWSAAAVAFCGVFNPATIVYTPGKDPMQLLTSLAIAYLICSASSKQKPFYGILAGVVTTIGLTIGLIHAWILAIALLATLLLAGNFNGLRSWLRSVFMPCAAGLLIVFILGYAIVGWNIPLTIWRVAHRYGQIQPPIITSPIYWTLIGLPLFLLFIGPCPWIQVLGMNRDVSNENSRAGRAILICTAAVMLYAYFFANNSETPRLWIPFVPLIILGLALRRQMFQVDSPGGRSFCTRLILIQLVLTIATWTLIDARESEWRLVTGRMWN